MNTSSTARPTAPRTNTPRLAIPDWIAFVLLIVGAVNWGLVGAFGFDLVAALFGPMTLVSRIVYLLVGLAGLYALTMPMRLRPQA
ncbi:MAG: DUF378 domain-containing protein [Janthinobacterium lividum]